MAYRSCSDSARHGAPPPRRGQALSRTTFIAGATLSSLALAAAGAVLLGNGGGLGHPAPYSSGHHGLEVALVDAAAPAVVKRDPRVAIVIPDADLIVAAPALAEATPLPHARPVQVAAIPDLIPMPTPTPLPMPRARVAAAEPETTGSLGETPHALGYAAFEPASLADKPAIAIVKPGAAVAARASEAIGPVRPVLPANRTLAARKPSRPLTPYEKLYGPVQLASLDPGDALRGSGLDPTSGVPRPPFDKQTAVYVITDKKVYMPDGRALEAHSGLGDKMDDPRFVRVRMRGATPPHLYDITLRESLFHGVEAIRMTPVGGDEAIFGRDGILAHSYMLGPNGQSNGCVSFKNYDAFLDAFKAGKVSRLAVMATLD